MIEFKNINHTDDIFSFGKYLTFTSANEMLLEAVNRYKIKGKKSKIGYKIIEQESKDILFNSRIVINGDIESLFNIILNNKGIDIDIKNYVKNVSDEAIIETSINIPEAKKQKEKVNDLREEKEQLVTLLREQEKESSNRELEHQEQLNRLKQEIDQIKQVVDSKGNEEQKLEHDRLNQIKALEEKRYQLEQQAQEKRNEEKRKRERHEKTLAELEKQKELAEEELSTLNEQVEMSEVERKKRRLELEEQQRELERSKELTLNQMTLEEAKVDAEFPLNNSEKEAPLTQAVSVPNIEEEEQNKWIIFSRKTWGIVKKITRYIFINSKRRIRIHQHNKRKKKAFDEQLQKEKIAFLKEIQRDQKYREKQITKDARERFKKQMSYERKEARYLSEIKKKKRSFPSRNIFRILTILLLIYIVFDFIINRDSSYLMIIQERGKSLYYLLIESIFRF